MVPFPGAIPNRMALETLGRDDVEVSKGSFLKQGGYVNIEFNECNKATRPKDFTIVFLQHC